MTAALAHPSLRLHPELSELFRAVESRHLTDDELAAYRAAAPEHADRAEAAAAIRAAEPKVVRGVVQGIFRLYPYEEHHEYATAKCTRDVRYVSAYATQAMLMGDPQWLNDKLLLWLKTILQAFEFPDRVQRRKLLFSSAAEDNKLQAMSAKVRSIHDCYSRLRDGYDEVLAPAHAAAIRPYLEQVIMTLTEEEGGA
jgi:hypothetical protein